MSRRIDGMLHGRRAEALGSHLAGCAACRLDAARLEHAWRALSGLEAPRPAPDDWERVEAMAESAGSPALPLGLRWRLSPDPVAGLVLAGMVSLGIAGGIAVSRAVLAPDRGGFEATVLSSALADLPWGSPAAGLDRAPHGRRLARGERP